MKILRVKYFTPLSLLIFLMPFLKMCEPKYYKESSLDSTFNSGSENYIADKDKVEKDSLILTSGVDSIHNGKDEEIDINAYQIAFFGLEQIIYQSLSWDALKDYDFLSEICFILMIILSLFIIVLSFRRKLLYVRTLAIINFILIFLSILFLILDDLIRSVADIKYGFYVFFFYTILLIFLSFEENHKLAEYV